MKNTMRKTIAMLLAVVMLVGLTACGGGDTETPTEADGRTVIYPAM